METSSDLYQNAKPDNARGGVRQLVAKQEQIRLQESAKFKATAKAPEFPSIRKISPITEL